MVTSLADGRSADWTDRLEMMQDGKADFVHSPRMAAADNKSMLTIIPTVQKIELLQVARWKCKYMYTSLYNTKALDALLPASSKLVQNAINQSCVSSLSRANWTPRQVTPIHDIHTYIHTCIHLYMQPVSSISCEALFSLLACSSGRLTGRPRSIKKRQRG
jgi:hypothetical protein